MADIVVILLIVAAIAVAIKKLSKKDKGCIGCPYCKDGVCQSKTK